MAITILNCVLLSPVIPLLGIYPQEVFVSVCEEACAKMFTGTLSINWWRKQKQLQCPVLWGEWQNKSWFLSSRGAIINNERSPDAVVGTRLRHTAVSHKAGVVLSYHIKQNRAITQTKLCVCIQYYMSI